MISGGRQEEVNRICYDARGEVEEPTAHGSLHSGDRSESLRKAQQRALDTASFRHVLR
jgi:hypothetical protein